MGKAHVKPITFEERKKIEKHIKAGLSCSETARLIGRSKNGVVSEVRRAGGRFYSAKVGQNLSDKIRKDHYDKLSSLNKKKDPTFNMKLRIENLEMQVEILHDTIKDILKR